MRFPITEHVAKTSRHTTSLSGLRTAERAVIIFLHGWPELSISWRHQLPCFGAMGFRVIAPECAAMAVPASIRPIRIMPCAKSHDMVELADSLGCEKAVCVGHDMGSPVAWSLASHYPDRCYGVASLCVPYIPGGFAWRNLVPLADRTIYPEADFPAAQWDYQLFYEEHFDEARADFEADIPTMIKLFFRAGDASGQGQPIHSATVRKNGGWFVGLPDARDLPLDESVISQEDYHQYVSALQRNGFFGPDSWYKNAERNIAYAAEAANDGRIDVPVLFIHGAYDWVCETKDSRLADPMRASCPNLTEATAKTGHWMAQEDPASVNAAIAQWLALKLPQIWPTALDRVS